MIFTGEVTSSSSSSRLGWYYATPAGGCPRSVVKENAFETYQAANAEIARRLRCEARKLNASAKRFEDAAAKAGSASAGFWGGPIDG